MLQFQISRYHTGDVGTIGWAQLVRMANVIDILFACDTIELPWRNNHQSLSCIPAGSYPAHVTFSPHFSAHLYELLNVPNRSDIRIHSGNFAGDTQKGFHSDVTGCILLGKSIGTLANQMAVLGSRLALADFHTVTRNESIEVAINWQCASPEQQISGVQREVV